MSINQEGKKIYEETKRIIKDAMDNNRLVLFVGAGCSADSGVPLWGSAIEQIATRLSLTKQDELYDSLKIPQYYYNSQGKNAYTQLMRSIFLYGEQLKTTELHKKIIECRAETIVTTNYDHLIEQASEENAEVRYVISKDADLPYKNTSRELIKMHGDFENDNFVLKEDDYLHYSSNFRLIETYIKSLLGTKVVLFVGYSLNDPDVKQIITWVKDTLKEDFKPAYLILTCKEKNDIEKEYFKNLGINIIYGSELVNGCNKNQNKQQLVEVLDYILSSNPEKLLDTVYNKLRPLTDLNYVYSKYIKNALYDTGIYFEGNTIKLYVNHENEEKENFKQLLWDCLNNKKVILNNEIDNKFNGSDYKKLELIKSVLCKSHFTKVCLAIDDKTQEEVELLSESYKLEEYVFNFDYKQLNDIMKNNLSKLSLNNPDLYMQQAYINTLLNDYYGAYGCLKNAARIYYKDKNYTWYFIAEFNRKYVGKNCLFFQNDLKFSKEEKEELSREINTINIEQILDTIPDLGNNHNEFLNDLGGFKITYQLFYDMFSESININKQARTAYSFFAGTTAFEKMRIVAQDYCNYETNNFIMLDRYNEIRSIYLLYLRSILSSFVAKEITNLNTNGETVEPPNIKVNSLNRFDIYIMLRYLNQSDLEKLFNEYEIKTLTINDDALKYIQNITDSIFLAKNYINNGYSYYEIFWTYLELLSHIEIDANLVVKVLKYLCEERNIMDFKTYNTCINRFIVSINKEEYKSNQDIPKYANEILNNVIEYLIKKSSSKSFFTTLIGNLLYICKKYERAYDNSRKISKLIDACGIANYVDFYKSFGIKSQRQFKKWFDSWEPNDNADGYCLYCKSVLSEIIKTNKEIEKRALNWVELNSHKEKESAVSFFPSPNNSYNVIVGLVNLYLNNKIVDIKRLKVITNMYGDNMSNWLSNMDDFDYSFFECDWLTLCGKDLLYKIADDETARNNILKAYKKQYDNKKVSTTANDIIVKYFLLRHKK